MRGLSSLLALPLILLLGCGPAGSAPTPPPLGVQSGTQAERGMPYLSAEKQAEIIQSYGVIPRDSPAVGPSKVNVGNFVAGARATAYVMIHNNHPFPAVYSIRVESYHDLTPAGIEDWVIIVDAAPVLAPFETRVIPVALDVPKGVVLPKHWEFVIAPMDETQGAVVINDNIVPRSSAKLSQVVDGTRVPLDLEQVFLLAPDQVKLVTASGYIPVDLRTVGIQVKGEPIVIESAKTAIIVDGAITPVDSSKTFRVIKSLRSSTTATVSASRWIVDMRP